MKLAIGAVLTFFAVALAGQRAERITRLIAHRPAGPRPVRARLGPPPGRAGRGLRAAQAAQAADPRAGPLLHLLGLRDPADHDRRGLRGAVQRHLRPPAGRPQPGARLPPGPDRGGGPGQPGRLRRHPRARVAGPPGPVVALLPLPHRPGLGHPRHDRPGDRHPAVLPGGQGGQGHLPLRRLGLRLHGGRGAARRAVALGPARCSTRASCWPTWRSCSGSWCWSCTPSTCTSSPPRSTSPSPAAPRPSARWPPPGSTPRR